MAHFSFESVPSAAVRRRLSSSVDSKKPHVTATYASLTVSLNSTVLDLIVAHLLQPMWAAVAGAVVNNNTQYEIAVSIHDSVYSTDFASMVIPYNPNNPDKNAKEIEQFVLQILRKFSIEHLCKFLGAGITLALLKEVHLLRDLLSIVFSYTFHLVSECMHPSLVGYGHRPICL